jgi:hypothetical protein
MEEMHNRVEYDPIIPSLLIEDKSNFKEYQKVLEAEEEGWRLKSHNLWLKADNYNKNVFHRQAKARIGKTKFKKLAKHMIILSQVKINLNRKPITIMKVCRRRMGGET